MANGNKSKYEQIQEELAQQIRQGTLSPGDKLPTEQNLAATYGVSRLTVRQAISGLISSGLVQSIQGKGSFVSEKPVLTSPLNTVHYMVSSYHDNPDNDQFNNTLLFHLGVEATRRGLVFCLSILPRHQTFKEFIRKYGLPPTFKGGVILNSLRIDPDDFDLLAAEHIPFVTMPGGIKNVKGPQVGSDCAEGMRICLENLLKSGHREIGLINCPVGYNDFQSNLDMYQKTLREANVEIKASNITTAFFCDEDEGGKAAEQLYKANPAMTALVVFGDRSASGAIRKLLAMGVRIPEDLSVVVHDRYSWMDSLFGFKPCGTHQNIAGIAHALMDTLERQRLSGTVENDITLISPDWIDGHSVAFHNFESLNRRSS